MGRALIPAFALGVLLSALPAAADRGALSVDGGGGGTAFQLTPPFTKSTQSVLATTFNATLGVRYALWDWLELGVSGFYEPNVPVYYDNVTLSTDNGDFSGKLGHKFNRFGALGGAYYKFGSVLRPTLGIEAGWSRRAYSDFHLYDVDDAHNPIDYHLTLPNFATDNFTLGAVLGLEWCITDHIGAMASLKPRAMLGPDSRLSLTGTITLSYSWYL